MAADRRGLTPVRAIPAQNRPRAASYPAGTPIWLSMLIGLRCDLGLDSACQLYTRELAAQVTAESRRHRAATCSPTRHGAVNDYRERSAGIGRSVTDSSTGVDVQHLSGDVRR